MESRILIIFHIFPIPHYGAMDCGDSNETPIGNNNNNKTTTQSTKSSVDVECDRKSRVMRPLNHIYGNKFADLNFIPSRLAAFMPHFV